MSRFGSLADITARIVDVRLLLKSGCAECRQSMSAKCHKRTFHKERSHPGRPMPKACRAGTERGKFPRMGNKERFRDKLTEPRMSCRKKWDEGHNTATTLITTNTVAASIRGLVMRDIRCDLQERAKIVEEQIRAIYAHFEKVVQQLQTERDASVAELQGTHSMISQLIEFESAFMDNVVPLENSQTSRQDKASRLSASG